MVPCGRWGLAALLRASSSHPRRRALSASPQSCISPNNERAFRDSGTSPATSARAKRGLRGVPPRNPRRTGRARPRRRGQSLRAADTAPPRRAAVIAGRVVAENGVRTVECPYHGWRYGTQDGVCKLIPSLRSKTSPTSRPHPRPGRFPDARGQRHRAVAFGLVRSALHRRAAAGPRNSICATSVNRNSHPPNLRRQHGQRRRRPDGPRARPLRQGINGGGARRARAGG